MFLIFEPGSLSSIGMESEMRPKNSICWVGYQGLWLIDRNPQVLQQENQAFRVFHGSLSAWCHNQDAVYIDDHSHAQSSENSHYQHCGLAKDPRGRRQNEREAVELVELPLPAKSQAQISATSPPSVVSFRFLLRGSLLLISRTRVPVVFGFATGVFPSRSRSPSHSSGTIGLR